MLEIWGRKNANQVIQVLWTLAELEIDYQRHSIGTRWRPRDRRIQISEPQFKNSNDSG